MTDEKRLYLCYICIYLLAVSTTYVIFAGFPAELKFDLVGRALVTGFAPSFFGVVLVNRYFWRLSWFRKLLGIRTPYIQGRWEGYIKSSFSKHVIQHQVVVEFWQDLRRVFVWYYDVNAVTHGLIAQFAHEYEGGPLRLYCVYHNQPIRTENKKLQPHHGVMELIVTEDTGTIRGIYYNNAHQRATYGEIQLAFKGRKLHKQFD